MMHRLLAVASRSLVPLAIAVAATVSLAGPAARPAVAQEAPRPPERRLRLLVGPIRGDADALRAREIGRRVPGVVEVGVRRGEVAGTVVLLVADRGVPPGAVIEALVRAGFQVRILEAPGGDRPRPGDRPGGDRPGRRPGPSDHPDDRRPR